MKLEDLKLYQECLNFEAEIWEIVNQWEGFNKDTVGKYFVQSSDAISGNIAAGYGRYNFNDKKYYCYVSRGHLLKTKGWLLKCKERNLIPDEKVEELIAFSEKIHRMLNAYIRSIGRKKTDTPREHESKNTYEENASENNTTEVDGNSYTASADEFFSSDELVNQ